MSFIRLMCKAGELDRKKLELEHEKIYSVALTKGQKPKRSLKQKYRHRCIDCRRKARKCCRKCLTFPEKSFLFRFFYKLRHAGTCENYTLKSIVGFISGFIITYVFFMFFVFQLNFKFSTATIMCSIFGSILTIGLAFSYKVRCVVFLTLPQLFSKRGRQALLAYAFILAITGPAKNTLNNMGILSESLACGQEQLKSAVKQILDVIKKPFYAIRDAIKAVVKVVKIVVKKIKEILLAIKRVILAIIKVIKAVFHFLAKIINICNKELGTPFQRCTRVFEGAIADCNAKLGPMFSWLCSITYLIQAVCYTVKMFDYVCMLVDFISDSIIGVVVKKVKNFIRHIKTMFYVRIKFSHSYHFENNASKSMEDVTKGIVTEVKARTEGLIKIFDFMSCATSLFFMFIIIRVLYYRYKFLTNERFDNRFITRDFRNIDIRRAQLGKETVLPLNHRERTVYITIGSCRLVEKEKLKLSQSAVVLFTATLKLATHMMADYVLYWVLMLIRTHASFQSSFEGDSIPTLHVKGEGLLADLLRSIVRAFQPVGVRLEIDTIPCLPDPIPPDYDRYVQIASLLVICWILTVFEPYGLRWRHSVMCFYQPLRARQRAVWLYNHILRTRSSFLKFARRQLRRKIMGDSTITKITCKEYLRANIRCRIFRICLGEDRQNSCLLCGEVFREEDPIKPIYCQTPGCPGVYCEQCFQDLQNLCTVCMDPIQYGDLSDISEEKDSSEISTRRLRERKKKKKLKRICRKRKPRKEDDSSDSEKKLIRPDSGSDSDYYSTDQRSSDLSYTYQHEKDITKKAVLPPEKHFVDVEKQPVPDYATLDTFREESRWSETSTTPTRTDSEKIKSVLSTTTDSDSPDRRKRLHRRLKGKSRGYFQRKRRTRQDHIPLLDKATSTDIDESPITETTFIDTPETRDMQIPMTRPARGHEVKTKPLEAASTDTTFIETPRELMESSTEITLVKKPNVPKNVPKLNLGPKPCGCHKRMYNQRHITYFYTESETSRSPKLTPRIHTTSSSNTTVAETSRSISTSEMDTSVSSPLPTKETQDPFYHLYAPEPSLENRKLSATRKIKYPVRETASNTSTSDAYNKSYKKKVRNYYDKINKVQLDNPKVATKQHKSKFTKFINHLLRKDYSDSSSSSSLTKSFLSESERRSSSAEANVKIPTSNVRKTLNSDRTTRLKKSGPTKSTNIFVNFLMGGSLSTQRHKKSTTTVKKPESDLSSDSSVEIIEVDKFGFYDSTDSEISELHHARSSTHKPVKKISPVRPPKPVKKISPVRPPQPVKKISPVTPPKPVKKISPIKAIPVVLESESNSSLPMSIDKRRSSLDRQNSSRYSREPPERDQNYDDSQMKKNISQTAEIRQYFETQGGKPCQCKTPGECKERFRRPCHEYGHPCSRRSNSAQSPNCPDRRRPSYESTKSVENLRQNEQPNYDQNRGSAGYPSKQRQNLSRSSPDVGKNRQNMKSDDMATDNSDYMYNDYMSTRSGPKNDGYGGSQVDNTVKSRYNKYPYEEPQYDNIYNNENHERNCACDHCNRRNQYRNCKCCQCCRGRNTPMDDQLSNYSDETCENGLNLAYQKNEDYPELVDEIENTISQRNKDRVKKTMRQFEILSRQNKGLDKPIYDDEEDDDNRYSCNKRNCPTYNRPKSRENEYYNGSNNKQRQYSYDRFNNYQTRSECLSERPVFSATPFPRNRGYVEKVARYMDPTLSDNPHKYPKYNSDYTNSRWQMDPRSGEWVKVFDDNYDFENNYPPLPAPPNMYREYDNYQKTPNCSSYYNPPQTRSQSPMKHMASNKACACRNCMNQQNNRY